MNLKQYISFFAIGTAIGWAAFILVMLNIDPAESGTVGLLLFYVTLTMGLSGLLTTVSTLIRVIRFPERDLEEVVIISLRQGFLLTLLVIFCLILLSIQLLVWWTMILSVAVVGMLEFLFILKQKRKNL